MADFESGDKRPDHDQEGQQTMQAYKGGLPKTSNATRTRPQRGPAERLFSPELHQGAVEAKNHGSFPPAEEDKNYRQEGRQTTSQAQQAQASAQKNGLNSNLKIEEEDIFSSKRHASSRYSQRPPTLANVASNNLNANHAHKQPRSRNHAVGNSHSKASYAGVGGHHSRTNAHPHTGQATHTTSAQASTSRQVRVGLSSGYTPVTKPGQATTSGSGAATSANGGGASATAAAAAGEADDEDFLIFSQPAFSPNAPYTANSHHSNSKHAMGKAPAKTVPKKSAKMLVAGIQDEDIFDRKRSSRK